MIGFVINRLYIHNFRCLENFDLRLTGQNSVLLIGHNGAGKTTVSRALEILQKIARGTNRVGELVKPADLARGHTASPLRIQIEADLHGQNFNYNVAFELPDGFKELRIFEEILVVNGNPLYIRKLARVTVATTNRDKEAEFNIDWHQAALPIIQERSEEDPLFVFRRWLARMLILRPVPPLMVGESNVESLELDPKALHFAAWFSGLLAHAPSAYAPIDRYLKQVMPDLKDIKNPLAGKDTRSMEVQFANAQGTLKLAFEDLSDGEKCFMISALVLAANEAYGPLLCFWDEPDSHLALSEVGHFVMTLRQAFERGGQFIATSNNPEAIRQFSDENTLVLTRNSHLEPTTVRPLADMQVAGDLVGALIRGDLV